MVEEAIDSMNSESNEIEGEFWSVDFDEFVTKTTCIYHMNMYGSMLVSQCQWTHVLAKMCAACCKATQCFVLYCVTGTQLLILLVFKTLQ